jgi:hypothetical protein
MKFLDGAMAQWNEGLPSDAEFSDQELIVVNAPHLLAGAFLIVRRASLGEVMPRSARFLAVTDDSVRLRRDEGRVLKMTLPRGLQRIPVVPGEHRRVGARRFPFREGDTVELEGFWARTTKVADGAPTEVEFRFTVSCDDPSLRWVRWTGSGYEAFVPPPVGSEMRVP